MSLKLSDKCAIFLSELSGAPAGMAAVFAGFGDPNVVYQLRERDLRFAADWDRVLAARDLPKRAPRARPALRPIAVTAWLRARGGKAQTSMRRLAGELGSSLASTHSELRCLQAAGVIRLTVTKSSTTLELLP
jgi:hypothetical protein